MATLRFNALQDALHREVKKIEELNRRSAVFNANVFDQLKMRQYLTSNYE